MRYRSNSMMKGRDHTVDDYLNFRYASNVDFSRDSTKIAFTVSGVFKNFKEEMATEIHLISRKDRKKKTFSRMGWSNYSPKLSPSGNKLAYLSKKEDDYRLMIKDISNDSETEIVVGGAVQELQWLDEESLILIIKDKDPLKDEKKKGDDGYFFEEKPLYDSLWSYNPKYGFQRITKGIQIWEFEANKETIAAITSSLPYEWSWYEAGVSLIGLKDHSVKRIYSMKNRQVAKPRLSPNNKRLVFLESLWSDRGVTSGDIISVDLRNLKSKNLTEGEEESFSEVRWKNNEEFYALSNKEGTFLISIFSGEKRKVLWSRYGCVYSPASPSFSFSGGNAVLSFDSSKKADEVILVDLMTGKDRAITNINDSLNGCKSYRSEIVTWKSTDGMRVSGIFRSARKNAPLMVIVHGGPTGSSLDSFIGNPTLFLSQGYSVFLPNYRGSTGRGRQFAEANLGDMGGMDLQDILSGVDYLVERKGVAKDKIYITGGSYGGFMSAWAITQTNIFKGSISLFGISDWISFHGVSNLPKWDRIHYDEDPYKFNRFVKFSPLRYVDKVNTPILLAHGIEDPYVPVGQYYQFYRALKDRGKDVRLLLFPREGHGFRERKHIEQFYREVFDWLKEHQ